MMGLYEEHDEDRDENKPSGSNHIRKRQDPVFALSTTLGRQVLSRGALDHAPSL